MNTGRAADFDGLDIATGPLFGRPFPDPFTDDYTAKKPEWLALVNVYVDLGTWHGITPFVGAGIGVDADHDSATSSTSARRRYRAPAATPTTSRVELRLGALCRPRLRDHAGADPRTRAIATSTWATPNPATSIAFDGTEHDRQPDGVRGHHLARREARRPLPVPVSQPRSVTAGRGQRPRPSLWSASPAVRERQHERAFDNLTTSDRRR